MTQVWTPSSEPAGNTGAADSVTLLAGSSFCISEPAGDVQPDRAQGLFVRDARVVSRWALSLDETTPTLLTVQREEPYSATYVARMPPPTGLADATVLVVRSRHVGNGMSETITVRNVGGAELRVVLRLRVDADFADLFEVKNGRAGSPEDVHRAVVSGGVTLSRSRGAHELAVRVHADADVTATEDGLRWDLVVPARSAWDTTVHVTPVLDGVPHGPHHGRPDPVADEDPARRLHEWRNGIPRLLTADPGYSAVLARSVEDLGALRIFDDRHPDRAVVAAGVPWFMALFGRDSLLTSWMLLPLDSSLAIGTLQTLADHQGTAQVALSEEEPGRILHEIRLGPTVDLTLGGRSVYYGSADASALFVMLLGELHRWGGDPAVIATLLPSADRALEWTTTYGDADRDGFVEYQRKSDIGLANQGWKDSWDAITFADGRIAETPIALAEVQGYTYAAYRARAHLAHAAGDAAGVRVWTERADHLKERFNEAFWLPDRGWFAVGLDRHKRPVDSLTSNIGHCLWTGIVDDDKAAAVADHLLSPEMFSGWGIRTLATSMTRYNPMSYHNGSVWPHDNAICVSGLTRYGFVDHAHRVIEAQLGAAAHFDHRLPELFCGFDRREFAEPVPYPTSCSPQAWAAATPLFFLRSLLRLDPELPSRRIFCAPSVPARLLPLTVDGIRLDGLTITIDVAADSWRLDGLDGTGIEVAEPPSAAASSRR